MWQATSFLGVYREVEAFPNRRHELDETSLVDEFRQWVRHANEWSQS